MLRPLGGVIRSWHPPAGGGDPLFAIAAAWAAIVGGDVARHSTPVELTDGELTVATHSSAWSHQLSFLVPEIRRRLAERGIDVRIERIRFRVRSRVPAPRAETSAQGRTALRPPDEALPQNEPVDAETTLRRLRARIEAVRRTNAQCATCGAPLPSGNRCGPCAARADRSRRTAAARLMFDMPWLSCEDICASVPELGPEGYADVRRELLARWWTALQRVKFTRNARPGASERRVATSYIVLQSRVSPDAITPAIVRNLLGEELEKMLFPA